MILTSWMTAKREMQNVAEEEEEEEEGQPMDGWMEGGKQQNNSKDPSPATLSPPHIPAPKELARIMLPAQTKSSMMYSWMTFHFQTLTSSVSVSLIFGSLLSLFVMRKETLGEQCLFIKNTRSH